MEKKAYLIKRRKRGAQPGNRNGDGLAKFLEQTRAAAPSPGEAEELEVAQAQGGLDREIYMLRRAMRLLDQASRQAVSVGDKIRAAQILSLMGERLATMLVAQKKLDGGESQLRKEVEAAIREVGEELGIKDTYGKLFRR